MDEQHDNSRISTWAELKTRFLERVVVIPDNAIEEHKRVERHSLGYRVTTWLLDLATEECRKENLTPDDLESIDVFEEAAELGAELAYCARGFLAYDSKVRAKSVSDLKQDFALNYWAEPRYLEHLIKEDGRLSLDWSAFEQAVGRYVDGRLKSKEIDRVLLVGIADLEITGFLEKMYRKDIFTGVVVADEARSSLPLRWLRGRLKSMLSSLLIALTTYILSRHWQTAPEWLESIGYGIAIIQFLIGSIVATTALPFAISKQKRAAKPILDLIDGMSSIYAELHNNSPISVRHIARRFEELRAIGAVWPGSLWVLLDDLQERKVSAI